MTPSNAQSETDHQQFLLHIDEKIKDIKAPEIPSSFGNPFTKIYYAYRINEIVLAKGILFKANGKINTVAKEVQFDVKIMTYLKIITLFSIGILISILFVDEVSNQDTDTTMLEKLSFVGIGILLFSLPVFVVLNFKKEFERTIKREFAR